ncbi:ABC-type transport auxiliary lipoprotein family protein [Halodesulfovibrio marinisediminis]|uniref:ABC-type uncharacterized transport system, auxiliary component n=1 Tax=Halodesulfovibrio marinisediminis DSM 17456 TaxID=1121457 RepID=A0A1N6DL19_9BACT|nr:ABC-type transport auxiliary lipoprotein family protein [Halodesulfovibrio marinisediminis]SIN71373.1 ABC-type uncharacterized transport system, auxiliary component [Halodesulfovibrio marinisediminis DSM 17456]
MRKLIVRLLIIPLILAVCSGCAIDVGLTPPEASTNYILAVSTASPTQTASRSVPTVAVRRPQTNTFLNSTGIAIIQPNQKALYYAKGKWATALPEMMQSAVIHSLNSTQQVRSYNNTQPGISADYHLVWSIEDFYARYDTKNTPPNIQVTLDCWLLDTSRASTPVASSVFTGQQTAKNKGLEAIVDAFNNSVEAALAEMNTWVTSNIEEHEHRKKMNSSRHAARN